MTTHSNDDAAFTRFAARCGKQLQRIARATRGELEANDVVGEAWMMARESSVDLDAAGADDFMLSRLYQRLVKYTELTVRHAVRLDHGSTEDEVHPLMHILASDEGSGPLEQLERRESAIDEERELDGSGSLAVAYVRLLRHFDNRMQAVADHLLISESWAYRRCARARVLAECQQSVATTLMPNHFMPGPWRPFQLRRVPMQLSLEFGDDRLLDD